MIAAVHTLTILVREMKGRLKCSVERDRPAPVPFCDCWSCDWRCRADAAVAELERRFDR